MTGRSIRVAVDAWLANPTAAKATYRPISTWVTSEVTDMSYLFCAKPDEPKCNYVASSFNEKIATWDTSRVTSMKEMFSWTSSFDQPLRRWRVDEVADMYATFYQASAFNQAINEWSVDKVTNMERMFYYASAFDQPLGNWNVFEVRAMRDMFRATGAFNQDLSDWSPVRNERTDMYGMFLDARVFNQDLGWCLDAKRGDWNDMFSGTPCKENECGCIISSLLQPCPGCGDCYGAKDDTHPCCDTCNEVKAAYGRKQWDYDNYCNNAEGNACTTNSDCDATNLPGELACCPEKFSQCEK